MVTHSKFICKASLCFLAKVWQTIVRLHIWPTFVEITLMMEFAVLVASILAGREIDWASLIIEQIHEVALKRSTSILFPCLLYRLYLELRVESLHQLDSLIKAQHTLDVRLIKGKENPMALL